MTTSPKAPGTVIICAIFALAGLAGCSKAGEQSEASSPSVAMPTVSAAPMPKQAAFKGGDTGAVADVEIVDCPTGKGSQTARLTITNSTKKPRDYAVMVIWLKKDSGTPLGSGQAVHKAAAPGKKTDLTVKGKLVDNADRCVLNVRAGALK
ncbi:hypothetical protein [Luteococcus sp. OSA5]|uniref:hypothetical protein n=1 Tax=Luteococcus sp. OSA5 TaxID=3401630 RepID=UPI003B42D0E1